MRGIYATAPRARQRRMLGTGGPAWPRPDPMRPPRRLLCSTQGSILAGHEAPGRAEREGGRGREREREREKRKREKEKERERERERERKREVRKREREKERERERVML